MLSATWKRAGVCWVLRSELGLSGGDRRSTPFSRITGAPTQFAFIYSSDCLGPPASEGLLGIVGGDCTIFSAAGADKRNLLSSPVVETSFVRAAALIYSLSPAAKATSRAKTVTQDRQVF
jgi:hypothetical protein